MTYGTDDWDSDPGHQPPSNPCPRVHPPAQVVTNAQHEFDTDPELRDLLARATAAPTVRRATERPRTPTYRSYERRARRRRPGAADASRRAVLAPAAANRGRHHRWRESDSPRPPIGKGDGVFEDALLRMLVEFDPVPTPVLEWVLTGGCRRPDFGCDMAFVRHERPHGQAAF